MKPALFDVYQGDGEVRANLAASLPANPVSMQEQGSYLADPELKEAVNVAIAVGQPLLLTGEPGCGKTRLADSVAHELGLLGPFKFNTRSTSKAQDLLYRFDAARRFYDIQAKDPRATVPANYVEYGELGKAINADRRAVVLIDEIDKAPRDFPNDLLHELDRMAFVVPELATNEQTRTARFRPLVFITSNSERQLPLPFLRRCVFFHVAFPDMLQLIKIVKERLGPDTLDPKLIEAAIDKFEAVRKLEGITKRPATSELLAWLTALRLRGVGAAELQSKHLSQLPLWQVLLKDREDYVRLRAAT